MKNNMCSLKRLIDNTNVIYKYNCPEKNCNFSKNSYIGYTECTLTRRLTYHLQKGSIKEHENTVHNKGLTRKKIVENTKILYKINEFRRLINMEALLIKLNNPYINQQDTGTTGLELSNVHIPVPMCCAVVNCHLVYSHLV